MSATLIKLAKEFDVLQTVGVHVSTHQIDGNVQAVANHKYHQEEDSAHNAATRARPPRYDAVWIGLQFADRADMKALIDRRVDAMVREGLLEEVRQLLS